ncbi:MAG: hypothetical protein IJ298_11195 [Ruminococcus sp.]|nr:hypothetical protein [Ruminococcus sp.]
MKKIFAMLLVVVLVLSLTACMNTSNTPKIQKVTDPTSVEGIEYKDYEDSLEGLCAYFADMGYAYDMPEATGDEMTDPVVMRADMIGADKGYKFTYTYAGETVVLELYSYTDTDSDFYKQAKSEGKITVTEELDEGTVDVVLSDNGKYLMIYNDPAEDAEREAAITEAFKGFYA